MRLLSLQPNASQDKRVALEMGALKLYRAFEKSRYSDPPHHYLEAAQEAAHRYPQSLFSLAIIIPAGDISFSGGNEDAILRFEAMCLQALQKGHAPRRHQILVLQQIAEMADLEWSPAHGRIAYAAYCQIEHLSE